ncbi:MAG: chemotaxis protein CheX [Thermodesulfobacteriota bacterium]|nr:chemotaxis protein CheX [Thermodesulfobacteriota bacterium]
MNEKIDDIILKTAAETLEKLAFMFASLYDPEEAIEKDPDTGVCVSFTGPFSGTLGMKVSGEVLGEIAVNMLGADDEDDITLDDKNDALKETINVICGNILPAIGGKQAVFNIGVPKIIPAGENITGKDGEDPVSDVKLSLDEGRCDLVLFVKGNIPEAGESFSG